MATEHVTTTSSSPTGTTSVAAAAAATTAREGTHAALHNMNGSANGGPARSASPASAFAPASPGISALGSALGPVFIASALAESTPLGGVQAEPHVDGMALLSAYVSDVSSTGLQQQQQQQQQHGAGSTSSRTASPSMMIQDLPAQMEASSSSSPLVSQGSVPAGGNATTSAPPVAAGALGALGASSSPNEAAPDTFPPDEQVQTGPFLEQLNLLKEMISSQDSSVVRQAVRDQWQKCLIGSEFHTFFVQNAIIRHAPPENLARILEAYGEIPVKLAKHEFIKHLSAPDFDELADAILPKVSSKFLDKVLARRLETIAAQSLVNALARAERLGYDLNDVVERGRPSAGPESVIPSRQPSVPAPLTQTPAAQSYIPHPPLPIQYTQKAAPKPSPTPMTSRIPSSSSGTPPVTPSAASTVPIRKPPRGIAYCEHCRRPCSSHQALLYHLKKAGCQSNPPNHDVDKDTCLHCGVTFSSSGGIHYHMKTGVCGYHSAETAETMESLIKAFMNSRLRTPHKANTPALPNQTNHFTPSQRQTPMQTQTQSYTPTAQVQAQAQAPRSSPMQGGDPYAHLTPERRKAFDAEMARVDQVYRDFFKEAMKLPTKQERDEEMAKVKNRYNTKQSTTRKKYGIRLRERRTAAEMELDQQRLLGTAYQKPAEKPAKRARLEYSNDNAQTAVFRPQPQPTSMASTNPSESPRRRVPLIEMGGLSGSQATAELVDPTTYLTPSSQQLQPRTSSTQIPLPATAPWAHRGTSDDPMQIDDENSDDDSGDDIPARRTVTQDA